MWWGKTAGTAARSNKCSRNFAIKLIVVVVDIYCSNSCCYCCSCGLDINLLSRTPLTHISSHTILLSLVIITLCCDKNANGRDRGCFRWEHCSLSISFYHPPSIPLSPLLDDRFYPRVSRTSAYLLKSFFPCARQHTFMLNNCYPSNGCVDECLSKGMVDDEWVVGVGKICCVWLLAAIL